MKLRLPALAIAGCVTSFVAGFWLGGGNGVTKHSAPGRAKTNTSTVMAPAVKDKGAGQSKSSNAPNAAGDDDQVATVLEVLRKPDRIQRMAAWLQLLEAADAEGLKVISQAMMNWYHSGGSAGNDELDFLQVREGQLLGRLALLDGFPKEPNGKIIQNHHRKMKGWASVDPAAAKAWIDSLEDGSVKSALRASWLEGAVSADLPAVEKLYAGLSPGEKSNALGPVMDALHRRDGMAGLMDWFSQQSASEDTLWPRREAFEKLMWRAGQTPEAEFQPVKQFILDPSNATCLIPFPNQNLANCIKNAKEEHGQTQTKTRRTQPGAGSREAVERDR